MAKVLARSTVTGREAWVPEHYLGHPVFGPNWEKVEEAPADPKLSDPGDVPDDPKISDAPELPVPPKVRPRPYPTSSALDAPSGNLEVGSLNPAETTPKE